MAKHSAFGDLTPLFLSGFKLSPLLLQNRPQRALTRPPCTLQLQSARSLHERPGQVIEDLTGHKPKKDAEVIEAKEVEPLVKRERKEEGRM